MIPYPYLYFPIYLYARGHVHTHTHTYILYPHSLPTPCNNPDSYSLLLLLHKLPVSSLSVLSVFHIIRHSLAASVLSSHTSPNSVASSHLRFTQTLPHLVLWMLVDFWEIPEHSIERSTRPLKLSLPKVIIGLHSLPVWGRPHQTIHSSGVPCLLSVIRKWKSQRHLKPFPFPH